MINCPKCKAELTENDVFCFVCGHKMEQPLQQQPATEGSAVLKPCPQCQAMPISADDVFCAECGFRLIPETPPVQESPKEEIPPVVEQPAVEQPAVEQPVVEQPAVEQPVVEQPIVEQPIVEQPVVIQPPVVQPPVVTPPAVAPPFQAPPKKKKGAGRVIFTIILILLLVTAFGGGVLGFLIYNGSVSRQQVSFIPASMLDMIPSAEGVADNATVTRYFVAYCSGQFDGAKEGVISNVYNNVDIKSENNDAAEVAFREQGMKEIKKFTKFSNYFVYSFSKMGDAIDKREEIIVDLKSKGYKPQFVTVKK